MGTFRIAFRDWRQEPVYGDLADVQAIDLSIIQEIIFYDLQGRSTSIYRAPTGSRHEPH
jgi:hypothetical protein